MQPLIRPLQRGFTLVEMMVVVAIIAMLAAIATSNMIRARKRAQAAKRAQRFGGDSGMTGRTPRDTPGLGW